MISLTVATASEQSHLAVGQQREHEQVEPHRHFRQKQVRQHPAQCIIFETFGKFLVWQVIGTAQVTQRPTQLPHLFQRTENAAQFHRRGHQAEHVRALKRTDAGHETVNRARIFGRKGFHIARQLVNVTGETEAPSADFIGEIAIIREIGIGAIVKNAKFPVNFMAGRTGAMAHEVMNAAVNQVVTMFPCLGHTARIGVMLENARAITIHPGVTAGGQAGNARANDDDGFF
jgi:hypothetical protein